MDLRVEPPRIKLFWVPPPPGIVIFRLFLTSFEYQLCPCYSCQKKMETKKNLHYFFYCRYMYHWNWFYFVLLDCDLENLIFNFPFSLYQINDPDPVIWVVSSQSNQVKRITQDYINELSISILMHASLC